MTGKIYGPSTSKTNHLQYVRHNHSGEANVFFKIGLMRQHVHGCRR